MSKDSDNVMLLDLFRERKRKADLEKVEKALKARFHPEMSVIDSSFDFNDGEDTLELVVARGDERYIVQVVWYNYMQKIEAALFTMEDYVDHILDKEDDDESH